ncbi:MAG TPA: hypothetical protein VML50_18440 [Anaeromyxobacter sp.]|nr:hypothetical protein [Anaeromyxobacter sp.]
MTLASPALVDAVGWTATGVFVASYFLAPGWLVRTQMLGALIWTGYGLLVRAPPVVAANVLVLAAAAWKARQPAAEVPGRIASPAARPPLRRTAPPELQG